MSASVLISGAALVVSGITAWLTLFHRGTVMMTRPTVIFFGPDGSRGPAKVFLRALLYCTSRKGRIIESMFVRLTRGDMVQTFNIWVYGEPRLVRGSGLFVGRDGVVFNHHFLLPRDSTEFRFLPGWYQLDVYVRLVSDKGHHRLFSQMLELPADVSRDMMTVDTGLYFDWVPDSGEYHRHLDRNPTQELNYALEQQVAITKSDLRPQGR